MGTSSGRSRGAIRGVVGRTAPYHFGVGLGVVKIGDGPVRQNTRTPAFAMAEVVPAAFTPPPCATVSPVIGVLATSVHRRG